VLPGITGSLVAGAFLERVLLPEVRERLEHAADHVTLGGVHRWWQRVDKTLGPASSGRAVLDVGALPLVDLLGFAVLHLEPWGDGFVGTIGGARGPAAILRTTTWDGDGHKAWRDAVRASRTAQARWGLVYSGRTLRIVDGQRTWSRRALEFDLARVVADERSATLLCALACRDALQSSDGACRLEGIVQRSERHGVEVQTALSRGVLDALTALVSALDAGRRRWDPQDSREAFEQSVTIVYRLLFLLFAEARGMVPTWHHIYREAYSIEALCRRGLERARPRGVWAAVQAMSRLAHAGCRAGELSVTAFNGRLFSPRHTPLAERARVSDALVSHAILSLATSPARDGREPIAYADLGVEQLGAIYETVLEYEPSGRPGPLVLVRTSHERKSTGSFYTPRAMTEFLVRRALHPLVAGRSTAEILGLRIVDPAMGSGAFLVAACRYLAATAERALVAEGAWLPDEDTRTRRAALRRIVAERCLYGVDVNPMAVQLARLSLWLTTLRGDRPLTFLDHHLTTGDSLVGVDLEHLARPPRPGATPRRDGWPLFPDDTASELAASVLPERFRLAVEPSDTAAGVRDKERALAALTAPGTPLSRWKTAANLWCSGWLWPRDRLSSGMYRDVLAALLDRHASLSDRQRSPLVNEATALAREQQFFHWEFEFPEVFFDDQGRRDAQGGFDAVVGNPPWDTLRADTGSRGERDRARGVQQVRLRFFRDAGLYRHQGHGHANRYQLFLERALQLTRPGGRIGLVLPSGFATDHGSSGLRRAVLDTVHVDRLVGFDNRRAIFPIHRDVKFLLVTGSTGGRTDRLVCAFGRSRVEWLDELPDAATEDPPEARPIVLSRSLLESLDPERLAFPLVGCPMDVAVLMDISAVIPKLGDDRGWGAAFGRELNATEDRKHFVAPRSAWEPGLLRVVEGKHLAPFRVLGGSSSRAISANTAGTLLDPHRTFRRARLGYRDVASATNRLTLIAAVLPAGAVSTHTIFCLKTHLGDNSQYCLLALLNSLAANYLVRLQVTTHVTTTLMARLPVPRPPHDSPAFRELARLARVLEQTGVEANQDAYVRLNTIAAQLYGLTQDRYEHIVATFPLLPATLRQACVRDHERCAEAPKH
jgi:hypothetical protein